MRVRGGDALRGRTAAGRRRRPPLLATVHDRIDGNGPRDLPRAATSPAPAAVRHRPRASGAAPSAGAAIAAAVRRPPPCHVNQ